MASAIFQNNGQFVLLCSDTGYVRSYWEKMILPGKMANKHKALASLTWIKTLSEANKCEKVVTNHDPDIKPPTIQL